MAIARSWTVAIALVIIAACADGRGLPAHLPAAPKSASDIFTRLGLEGLSLDMFPGDEGDTVTRTFSDEPGKTKTVSVTRSPGGAVSVQASTELSSSLDGLPSEFGSSDFRPSELDFPSLQSVIDAVSQKAGPTAQTGSVFRTPTPAKAAPVKTGSVFKTPAPAKAAPTKGTKATKVKSTPAPASKKKAGKKGGKKSSATTTIVTDQQSAVVVAPVVPVEQEAIPDLFTINGAQKEQVETGIPALPRVGIPTAAPLVTPTPTRNAGGRANSGPGRVRVEENTRASSKNGPFADLRATRVEKDGVTATLVSGSRVAPAPFTTAAPAPVSAGKATVEACSDTETTTEAVERCVNAVRQNPAKYAELLPCSIPSYTPRAPLATSSHLSVAAAAHAFDMASTQTVTHAGSDGSTMGKRIWERAGFVGSPIAENVAGGQRSAKDVVFAWMCSTGHRKNIMSCEHDSMGTGLTRNGRVYWAQTFGCTKYNKCVC